METAAPPSPGFLGSFRALGENLLGTLHDRLELVSLELQEEKYRLIQTYIWITAATFAGMMVIVFASLTLVYLCWEHARLAALAGLTAFYAAALVAIVFAFRRYLARQPGPFLATREELGKDRACIRKLNSSV